MTTMMVKINCRGFNHVSYTIDTVIVPLKKSSVQFEWAYSPLTREIIIRFYHEHDATLFLLKYDTAKIIGDEDEEKLLEL